MKQNRSSKKDCLLVSSIAAYWFTFLSYIGLNSMSAYYSKGISSCQNESGTCKELTGFFSVFTEISILSATLSMVLTMDILNFLIWRSVYLIGFMIFSPPMNCLWLLISRWYIPILSWVMFCVQSGVRLLWFFVVGGWGRSGSRESGVVEDHPMKTLLP